MIEVRPVYSIPEGEYTFEKLMELDPETAHYTDLAIRRWSEVLKPLPEVFSNIEYRRVNLEDINSWVSLVYGWYVKGMDNTVRDFEMGKISKEELCTFKVMFCNGADYIGFVSELAEDFERIDKLVDLISRTGVYYPPTLDRNLNTIDGAHRCVALRYLGVREIYAWIFRYVEVD